MSNNSSSDITSREYIKNERKIYFYFTQLNLKTPRSEITHLNPIAFIQWFTDA